MQEPNSFALHLQKFDLVLYMLYVPNTSETLETGVESLQLHQAIFNLLATDAGRGGCYQH